MSKETDTSAGEKTSSLPSVDGGEKEGIATTGESQKEGQPWNPAAEEPVQAMGDLGGSLIRVEAEEKNLTTESKKRVTTPGDNTS